MAEIIGVVASGIAVGQLVGQVGNSLMKIRDFWERMGDAPGDLKTSLLEIEALYLVLTSISEEQQNSISSPGRAQDRSMERTVTLCHDAMDELTKLVRELDLTLKGSSRLKRKIATVRATLKKSQIERFKARLNSAILLLSLCCQCHTR